MTGNTTVEWGDLFSLYLPAGWEWEDSADTISVFKADGVGALNISIVSWEDRDRTALAACVLLSKTHIQQRAWGIPESAIHTVGTESLAASEFEFTELGDNSGYWQVWYVANRLRAAFFTYTCDPDEAQVEAAERKKIVDSFRWL